MLYFVLKPSKSQKMSKFVLIILVGFISIQPSFGQFKDLVKKAKENASVLTSKGGEGIDIGSGLKEALNVGVDAAVQSLSKEKGYLESPYKILIPADAQKIINRVKMVPGFEDVETKLINQMNKAAEIAAKKATPIFINAITSMTISDAKAILGGADNAATVYLTNTSRQSLYNEFTPVIQASLDEVNARSYWKSVVDVYNKIPLVKKLNPSLDDHVTNKGLDGLFDLIAIKEKGIRSDVDQRTSDLLKKVFGSRK
jgi:hypothetical protein